MKYGTEEDGYVNYVKGANIAGSMKAPCNDGAGYLVIETRGCC